MVQYCIRAITEKIEIIMWPQRNKYLGISRFISYISKNFCIFLSTVQLICYKIYKKIFSNNVSKNCIKSLFFATKMQFNMHSIGKLIGCTSDFFVVFFCFVFFPLQIKWYVWTFSMNQNIICWVQTRHENLERDLEDPRFT